METGVTRKIDRREFLLSSGAFASAAAFGMVPTAGLRLKVGIVSDTHIQDEASARHFEKALRCFRPTYRRASNPMCAQFE
jgi:hypothetical protein